MIVPLEFLLERAFQDWNLEINYTEVNAMLREQEQQQILLEHIGEERRGTLQIEDMRAEVREARMQYFTMNRGLILTSNVFIRILEDDGYLAAWPVGEVSQIMIHWKREGKGVASASCLEKVLMDLKPDAISEAKESKWIKSKVSAPYPATPKSWPELIKSEMDISRQASPASLITSKPIKVAASESEQATPDVALLCPARPDEHLPLPQTFPGFAMMPMMNMMPLGMFPFPDSMFNPYWNPLMLPTQPPFIPLDNEKEKEDEEVEDAGDEKEEEGEDTLPPLEPLINDYLVKLKEEWEEEDYIPDGQEEYVWMMNSKGNFFEFKFISLK
ncbi:hypothetical protein CAEBREN_18778 [Caenorhabditis brenneri]|uniref:Uncharacterized protein n=1 Tax=Caenorhabditis brenneri TaxID=135651 RepID=G0NGI7_CAEBE|nr:hypothetical protein CAEBREN_18778 [Caenorhabditis brenneri]